MLNSKLIFIIAFIAVLTGLYGVTDKLLSTPDVITTSVNDESDISTFKTVTFWQLQESLKKGSMISFAELKRVQLDEREALALGVNTNVDLKLSPQSLLNLPVESGTYLFPEQITRPGEPGYLSLITREGMTMYPLTVATKNLIQGYILPGDEIDIMTVSSPEHNLANDTNRIDDFIGLQASLLMTKVKVISITESDGDGDGKSRGINPNMKSSNKAETRIVIEVYPDDLARLTLAQKTMYFEVYHSQVYNAKAEADLSDVIKNYTNIVELRGSKDNSAGRVF